MARKPRTTTPLTIPAKPAPAVASPTGAGPIPPQFQAFVDSGTMTADQAHALAAQAQQKGGLSKQASDYADFYLKQLSLTPGQYDPNVAEWQDLLNQYFTSLGEPHTYSRGFLDAQTRADTVEMAGFMYDNGFDTKPDGIAAAVRARAATALDSGLAGRAPIFRPGVVGGGGRYSINLTNPEEIRMVADQAAWSLLGRKASPEEQDRLISTIQGQQKAEGEKGIAVKESQKRAEFQTSVMERDASAQAAAAQAAPGPAAPTSAGPGLANVGGVQVSSDIAGAVQNVLQQFGVTATSGYRSPEHNASVGGAENSDHLSGKAVDFSGTAQQMNALYQWANNNAAALGLWVEPMSQAQNHVHISWRGGGQPGAAASAPPAVQTGPDVYLPPQTTNIVQSESPQTAAYRAFTAPGSPTELEYGGHQAATSVYDTMMRVIKGEIDVSGGKSNVI